MLSSWLSALTRSNTRLLIVLLAPFRYMMGNISVPRYGTCRYQHVPNIFLAAESKRAGLFVLALLIPGIFTALFA